MSQEFIQYSGAVLAWTVLCHMLGDYIIQSHWMANVKTKSQWVVLLHAFTYMLPFLLLTRSLLALLVILFTHAVIDHWRLARYVNYVRNFFAPKGWRAERDSPTGSPKSAPEFISVWLLFITDNVMHILINFASVMWL